MDAREAILDSWFESVLEEYGRETAPFLAREQDTFRNPVGQTLKKSLEVLLQELTEDMDSSRLGPAMAAVVRLRAIQGLAASEALGFVFRLRTIVPEHLPEMEEDLLSRRVDQLAMLAFEEYARCREQLAEIRLNEGRRAMAVPAALSQMRS
jgi:hypothetical protein